MASKVIGRVEIRVAAKVDNSRPGMQRDMERELDKAERKINQRRPIKIPVDLDDDRFKEKLRRMEQETAKDKRFKITADFDYTKVKQGTEDVKKHIKSVERAKVTMDLDATKFKERMRQLDKTTSTTASLKLNEESVAHVKNRLDHFQKEASKEVDVGVNLHGLAFAGTRLSYLTRPRTVSIIAKVNAKSLVIAKGLLQSLAGVNTLRKFGESLENIITDFDRFATGIVKTMTIAGSFTNVLGYMATSLVSIGGGISQVIGLAAVIPTLAVGLVSVWSVLRMGFNNFAQSFSEIPIVAEQALAKLPPAARKARDQLQEVFRGFSDPIQNLFWENLGDSMSTFATVIVPKVRKGLLSITPATARMTKAMLDSFEEISRNTMMDTMFDNLADGLGKATKGVKPFFDAINTLGFRGSFFFGRMGDALADMAIDFNEFIQHAEKMGHIEGWINGGLSALKDTWGVVIALKDQFKALTQVIDSAGGQSLDGFRRNMEGWARVMESEPFRSRMVRMFRGARDGASELARGVEALGDTFGKASHQVEALEIQIGRIGGGALERISDILGRPMLQAGLLNGLLEVEHALDILRPAAKNMGDIFGIMFDIAGNSVLGVAPMLNQVTDILRMIAMDLGPSLKETIPTLTEFLRNLIELGGGSLRLVTTVLGGVLDVVNNLPGPMKNFALAFGTFLALRGRLGGMLTAMSGFWNKQRTSFKDGAAVVQTNSQKITKGYDRMVTQSTASLKRMSTAVRTNLGQAMWNRTLIGTRALDTFVGNAGGAATRFESTMGRFKSAATGISRALGSIMSFAGGLGGALVFTGIIAGISAIGAAARKEKEAVRDFGSTLDEFGEQTKASAEANARWLTDTTVGFGDFGLSMKDALESIGISSKEAVRALSSSGDEYGAFIGKINDAINDNTNKGKAFFEQAIDGSGQLSQENQRTYDSYLKQGDALNGLKKQVEDYQRIIDLAKDRQKDMAKALGVTNAESKTLDDAIRTLGDEYADAGDKATAMSKAIDVLNGGLADTDDATLAAADAVRALKDTIKELTSGENKISLKDMIDMDTGKIDISFGGDPTGGFARIQADMRDTMRTGIEEGIAAADVSPPAGKLTALKARYEEALRELKANIIPQLGKGGEKKLDAWLKANGYEWDTIKAIVTGEIDQAGWAAIPEEGRKLLKELIGTDPFVDIPIDGNYLPLEGKMTIADGMLKKLGATKTTPKIDGDGKPLDKVTVSAIEKLRTIENADVKAIIDGDIQPFTEKEQIALRKLMGIGKITALPTIDANGKPLADETVIATAMLLGFSKKEAIAFLKANKKDVDEKTKAAQTGIDKIKQKKPIVLDANGEPLKDQTQAGQANIDKIKQKTPPKVDANGEPLKDQTRAAQVSIDRIKQKSKPKVDSDIKPLTGKVNTATGKLNTLGAKHVTPSATISVYGLGQLGYAKQLLESLKSRHIRNTITTHETKTYGQGRAANGGFTGVNSKYPIEWKNYADGGLSSKPTSAHFASAGSLVTYAEKETGGEAFIPLAASKRARSLAIWNETGRRLNAFADGAVNTQQGGSGATYNITNHYPQAEPTSSSLNRAAQISTIRDRS